MTGPETQPSDNTQASLGSSGWDAALKLHIQKGISEKMIGYRHLIPQNSQNIILLEENKADRIGRQCETVQAIKTGGEGGRGWVHKLAGQARRQATVHLRTEAAPFHHSTDH